MAGVQIVAIPNPFMLDWANWAAFVVGYNPGLLDKVDPHDDWRTFALRLCEVVPEAPQATTFADWQDWARALKLVLQL
jgi:hypothetical protein